MVTFIYLSTSAKLGLALDKLYTHSNGYLNVYFSMIGCHYLIPALVPITLETKLPLLKATHNKTNHDILKCDAYCLYKRNFLAQIT